MLEKILRTTEKFIPKSLYRMGQPIYHYLLAWVGAMKYGFPSRKLTVLGVTGTKGKSTTVELLAAMLRDSGKKVALTSTVHFTIGEKEIPNKYKMSMPGRFFMQKFLSDAVKAGCTHVVLEATSEGSRFFRHTFIDFDCLVFTNLSPEHIESHGSYEKYRDAKLSIARKLSRSKKPKKVLIVNGDDPESEHFLKIPTDVQISFSLDEAEPHETAKKTSSLTWAGEQVSTRLPGTFNIYNMLAAATAAKAFGVADDSIRRTLEGFGGVRGRVEYVGEQSNFDVVVDYAHTIDSLEQFYSVFEEGYNICILGNTGGGRDSWKRPEMAATAEQHCDRVVLTNEDPYDEDPQAILDQMAEGVKDKNKLDVILDRREAFRAAFKRAGQEASNGKKDVNVLITGKGTDPYIMGPNGTKQEWDDARIAREVLAELT